MRDVQTTSSPQTEINPQKNKLEDHKFRRGQKKKDEIDRKKIPRHLIPTKIPMLMGKFCECEKARLWPGGFLNIG